MTSVNRKKFTLPLVQQKLSKLTSTIMILDQPYIDSGVPLNVQCVTCKFCWSARWDHLKRGHGCPQCSHVKPLTIAEVKQKLANINSNLIILDDVFVNAASKLQVYCKIHDSIQLVNWRNLKYNKGCRKCGISKRSGESHHNWNGGRTELIPYFRQIISEWKLESMKSANYKCDITGEPFTDIHHVYPFEKILSETFEICKLDVRERISNYNEDELRQLSYTIKYLHKHKYPLGICLTNEIHMLFHKIYGRKNTTLQQYVEFKNNYNKRND